MNPQKIDAWIQLAAGILRMVAEAAKWGGGKKLASELEAMAAQVDAFRTDPVLKAEIDAMKHGHSWGDEVPPIGNEP